MSSPNEQLEPTPFEVAPAAPAAAQANKAPPRWVWPTLGGLLVIALLVVFWLPRQLDEPQPEVPGGSNAASVNDDDPTANPAKAIPTNDASPWSDAQAAKLRKEAQDVLQELLELQFSLEERGARQWAAQAYGAASDSATAGDELYRQRQYNEAKAHYEESLATLQAITESIPAIVDEQLELARQGIEEGDREKVSAALELATAIEPENARLAALQQRAQQLEPLLALLQQAAEAEQSGDLALAQEHLQRATALDKEHQFAASELQRVAAAYLDQRFNDAMSDGYSALDEQRFDQARTHFREAASLQSGSAEAASALQEVATAQQASRLTQLKNTGRKQQQAEQWQQAVDAYEQALAIDSNVLFAAEGLERSRARARLDKQFSTAIDQPQRLSDVAVAEATEKLLQQAQTLQPRGPKLAHQISQLQTLLQQANTQVAVTLRSDEETEVIIYKVARLGKFQQQELTLRPGTYNIRGSRNGYRDVLASVTISHKGAPAPITIACKEPIN